MAKFEKIVEFYPAYDKRNADPNKNYGIGSVQILFALKKGNKAVQFLFGTNWFLPETIEEYLRIGNKGKTAPYDLTRGKQLHGWDVGYHSPKPTYKGHKPMKGKCRVLHGKCYYDGSTLRAVDNEEILIREGSEGIWKFLEKDWEARFGKRKKLSEADKWAICHHVPIVGKGGKEIKGHKK